MAKRNREFPDLTGPKGKKDGKVTKADILAGRGVIPKADEWFVDEVMSRVEENILLEEEHIQNVLAEAEEHGIDVDYLTEEELSELFGFGMDRSTSRSRTARARMGAPKGSRRRNRAEGRVARRKRIKSQRASMMDRLAQVSAERKAAKAGSAQEPAAPAAAPKDNAVKTLAAKDKTKGSGEEEKSSGGKPTRAALRQKTNRRLSQVKNAATAHANNPYAQQSRKIDSTDIVRGARLALAERVLDILMNRED